MAKVAKFVCLFLAVILVAMKAQAKIQDGALSHAEEDGHDAVTVEAPKMIRRLGKNHSYDKSVAGGGVIIGGLVTAMFAAVFCYIRVTRRKDNMPAVTQL